MIESKGRGFESRQERRDNFLLQGQLSVLTFISVSVPPPCYRQKCRWQVTAKYACTLHMRLCVTWHMVLCKNQTALQLHYVVDIQSAVKSYIHSFRVTYMPQEGSESARERRIALNKSDQHNRPTQSVRVGMVSVDVKQHWRNRPTRAV